MPSNETLELLENVLSSVSESERWQYRQADLIKKKRDDLDKKIENEKRKVEYYGKDPATLEYLKKEKSKIPNVSDDKLMIYRKGIDPNRIGDPKTSKKLNFDNNQTTIKRRHNNLVNYEDNDTHLYNTITDKHKALNILNKKEKALHDRINKRTAAFDTTAKHEATMILIEALNTLLNE